MYCNRALTEQQKSTNVEISPKQTNLTVISKSKQIKNRAAALLNRKVKSNNATMR